MTEGAVAEGMAGLERLVRLTLSPRSSFRPSFAFVRSPIFPPRTSVDRSGRPKRPVLDSLLVDYSTLDPGATCTTTSPRLGIAPTSRQPPPSSHLLSTNSLHSNWFGSPGESAVGKSSLVLRFVRDEFSDFRESTIGSYLLLPAPVPFDPSRSSSA